MRRRARIGLVALALACGPAPPALDRGRETAEAAASPAPDLAAEPVATEPVAAEPVAAGADEAVAAVVERVNTERRRRGAPPLTVDLRVTAAAEDLARELADAGGVREDAIARRGIDGQWTANRLAAHGYAMKRLVQALIQASGPPAGAVDQWARRQPSGLQDLLDPELRDLGVGVAVVGKERLYALVATLSLTDSLAPATARLADLEAVRREMSAAVDAERRRVGLPPLARSPALDRAAQAHATHMLAADFFAHESPAGESVADRAAAAGYRAAQVGENIAYGQTDVAGAMAGWMASPGHRANLLDPAFRELGTGVAHGPVEGGYRLYWVQVFGTSR